MFKKQSTVYKLDARRKYIPCIEPNKFSRDKNKKKE